MSPSGQRPYADPDSTCARLRARHEALERQLEAALRRAGLPRDSLVRAARAGAAAPAARLEELRAQIEAGAPALPGLSYEELCRPSLEEISRGHPRQLLRV